MIEKHYQLKKNLNEITPYLKDIKNSLKKFDTWKIQLAISINFIFSKDDTDEEHLMHSKSNKRQTMINDEADEVIKELFKSLLIDIKMVWKN